MIIKTAELEGAALDAAVAITQGWSYDIVDGDWLFHCSAMIPSELYHPSTDWAQGGPLIEKHDVDFLEHCQDDNGQDQHTALCVSSESLMFCGGVGTTRLIAAMRAIVTAKLGDEVDVPDELTN